MQGPEKAMPRQLLKDFDQAFCAKSQPRSQSSFCIDLQSMSSPSPSRKCAPQIGSSLAGSFDASQLPHTLGLSQSLDNGFLCDNSCDPLECQQSMIHPQTASLPVVQAQPHDTCKIQTDESPVAKGIERAQEFQSTRSDMQTASFLTPLDLACRLSFSIAKDTLQLHVGASMILMK